MLILFRRHRPNLVRGLFALSALLLFVTYSAPTALALSQKQKDIYKESINFYDIATCGGDISSIDATTPLAGGSCCNGSGSSTVLVGNTNQDQVWNYFIGKGLSPAQVAGIMGNIQQESSFDPLEMEIGGRSKNPYDAGSAGWGLIQWSGNAGPTSTGDKVTTEYKQSGVTGKIYTLATQLDLVWQNMNNHPIVTQPFDMAHFKSITDPVTAAEYFGSQIEGFGITGSRFKDAPGFLSQYGNGGGGGGSSGITTNDCGTATGSPDCTQATGTAKILCEARKYDPVSYVWGGGHAGGAAYHKACPTISSTDNNCGLDCSGLVSVAVYDAFNNPGSWDTNAIRSDSANWKNIPVGQVQAGDLIEPDSGHVEIVDHISGGDVYTFGAHSADRPQPAQVSPSKYQGAVTNSSYLFYRYVGIGSS